MKTTLARAVKGGTDKLQQLAKKASERLGSPEAAAKGTLLGPDSSEVQQQPGSTTANSYSGVQLARPPGPRPPPGSGARSGGAGLGQAAAGAGAAVAVVQVEAQVDPVLEHLLLKKKVRSAAVRKEFLQVPAEAYTAHHDVKLLVGTFNCNGRRPPPGIDLAPWLGGARFADLVAVGLQEMVPLNATNVVIGSGVEAAQDWDRIVDAFLNGRGGSSVAAAASGAAAAGAGKGDAAVDESKGSEQWRACGAGEHANSEEEEQQQRQSQQVEAATEHLAALSTAVTSQTQEAHEQHSSGGSVSETEPQLQNGGAAERSVAGTPSPAAANGQPAQEEFVQVASRQLVGVYLSVWARRALLPNLRGVQVISVGTGVLGMLGNKGAVAVRLRLYDSSLCIVNSHLSSGEGPDSLQRRLYDFGEIIRRGYFPPEDEAAAAAAAAASSALSPGDGIPGQGAAAAASAAEGSRATQAEAPIQRLGQWGSELHMLDSELLVWAGDLNFRVQGADDSKARALIRTGQLDELFAQDELRNVMRDGLAFEGFVEGPIRFPPTYKLRRGTNLYIGDSLSSASGPAAGSDTAPPTPEVAPPGQAEDRDGSGSSVHGSEGAAAGGSSSAKPEKVRAPAWTDRVLYRELRLGAMRLMAYSSALGLSMSDHHPVMAAFILRSREYVREQVAATIEASRKVVDAREMALTPHCKLQPTSLDLGCLSYVQRHSLPLVLSATGGAPAAWEMAPVPGSAAACPPWLSLHPSSGVLRHGESIELRLSACVSGGTSGGAEVIVAEAGAQLDSILVLRVNGGNTMFLSVTGTFQPSFFGLSLETLASLPRPIRSSSPAAAALAPGTAGGDLEPVAQVPSVTQQAGEIPPEVLRLTDLLQQGSGLQPPGLFLFTAEAATASSLSTEGSGDANGSPQHGPSEVAAEERGSSSIGAASAAGTSGGSSSTGSEAAAVHGMRDCLDTGAPFPSGAGAHQAAATLLAWFAALPRPLLPAAAAQVCDICEPMPGTAVRVLEDAMPPASGPARAVYDHVMAILRRALEPSNAEHSGLTSGTLALLLAEVWFPPLPRSLVARGGSSTRGDSAHVVAAVQAAADSIAEVQQRRIGFVQQLLAP